jgi:protein O-GlcNAc transferase
MRFGTIAEIVILVIFLMVALVTILVSNPAETSEDARNAEEYIQTGNRFYEMGKPKFNEASIEYWKAIDLNPDMAEAHFKLASIYYERVWDYQALGELDKVERIDPNYPGLYSLLGKIYNRMSEPDKALEAFQRALALHPEDSDAHYYVGTIYQQQGMEKEAIDSYEKAVEAYDGEAAMKAYLQLGRIYKNKDREKAKDQFMKALSIDPTSAEILSELRSVYRQEAEDYRSRDEYDKAAEKYEEMIKLNPDDPRNVEAYMELGNIYRSNELYDKASEMYEAARKLDPFNFDAFSALKELELLKEAGSDNEGME